MSAQPQQPSLYERFRQKRNAFKRSRGYMRFKNFRDKLNLTIRYGLAYGRVPRIDLDWPPQWCVKGEDYFAQYGQDLYILRHVLPDVKNGVFVDVGANHPIYLSNTYLLEKKGWTGLAIEPLHDFDKIWHEERTTPYLHYVLGDEEKTVQFGDCDAKSLSGVKGFVENKACGEVVFTEREQKRLDTLLLEQGLLRIDLLSVDVEGYEINVLKGIDFSKIDIRCIILENDHSLFGDTEIRSFLFARGYSLFARLRGDDIYMKNPDAALAG